ncbi:NAD-dependent deacylase [bacterium]|nr:NAD-dependent deacylase [bacterium]
MSGDLNPRIRQAAEWLLSSHHAIAFTGAGISVESGIPPFRGENGLWNRYDPACIELSRFLSQPADSWMKIREIFYEFMGEARANDAHRALAELEDMGIIKWVITQNIDFLHQQAGSINVTEFHGSIGSLHCLHCGRPMPVEELSWTPFPPQCISCGGLLKPDFVFFGEAIPEEAMATSIRQAEKADLVVLIGTTGEVVPASMIPQMAKRGGARIIEINTTPSRYTDSITDLFLQGSASAMLTRVMKEIGEKQAAG